MSLLTVIKNEIRAAIGYKQKFESLIESKDISRAIACMENRESFIDAALYEYNVETHEVMKRIDKPITDKKGNVTRTEKRWKLPIPYQVFINEIALVFLYGRPVKWTQNSRGTDKSFEEFNNLMKRIRFDSRIRQAKRIAGAETESAIFFRVFRNEEGKPDCQVKVLARSLGDDLRFIFDEYGNMIAAGWGYYTKTDAEKDSTYNFNIYTSKQEFHCRRDGILTGWNVDIRTNEIGKIPIILFRQEKEWHGVQSLIEREEWIGSRSADTNDYFADPIAIINADIIKNVPEKNEEAKLLVRSGGDANQKGVEYATWDAASESKENEKKWLEKHILTKSFTPNFDYDSLSGLTNASGKAMQQLFLLADIKAAKRKESHDELLDRTASLCRSIIGNVLNVGMKGEVEKLEIGHEFQAPFGDDIKEMVDMLATAYESGGISLETYVERNPLVTDSKSEMERIKAEEDERATRAQKTASGVFEQVY